VQTVRALQDAVSYDGVSLIIAYSHCIAHGYELSAGLDQQKAAVQAGYWPLYRYDPRKRDSGENPLKLDSSLPSLSLTDFMHSEGRFRITERLDPEQYQNLLQQADLQIRQRFERLQQLAGEDNAEKS